MKRSLVILLIIILIGIIIYLSLNLRKLNQNIDRGFYNKTETIYSSKPLRLDDPLKVVLPPINVTLYPKELVPYKELVIIKDTIRLYNSENHLDINKYFLLQYPKASKLISLDLTSSKLELNLLDINGLVKKEEYPIDLSNNKYLYIDNCLTYEPIKPKFKFGFDAQYYFRPINNLHDLNLNLKLDTRNFTYRLGINTFFYPNMNKRIGIDPIISVQYNF